MIAQELEH